jgi:dCTP deaminase
MRGAKRVVTIERMQLLRDEELHSLIVGAKQPLVSPLRTPSDWYGKESPIQPSSVDLTVGDIYIPPRNPSFPGATFSTESNCVLNTGHTAMVSTAQTLKLPNNIAAIGFPPSHVSIQGLLMTNPGHIDPGYEGPMHLTVINMGLKPFSLRRGDVIATLLFYRLGADARAGYQARYGPPPYASQADQSLKLSFDFVDVDNRARNIAADAIRASEYQVKRWTVWASIIVALIAFCAGFVDNYLATSARIDQIKSEVATIDKRTADSLQISKELADHESRIKTLETKRK